MSLCGCKACHVADMMKCETLEPLGKDQIIDQFVESSKKVENHLNETKGVFVF